LSALIIDGRTVSDSLKQKIRDQIRGLATRGIHPKLTAVLVGEDPASKVYIRNKEKACVETGIAHETLRLPETTGEKELRQIIERLNHDASVSGILVQLPLPKHISEKTIINAMRPEKDVDCFHPYNVGQLMLGDAVFAPCTPAGVMELLHYYQIDPAGRHAVIVGRSNIVGKPLANLLVQKAKGANAVVTLCHTGAKDLSQYTRQADILIAAVGKPRVITADMVKPGAVVIDVGINRIDDPSAQSGSRLVGDVDFESVKEIASAITPVPGGVGLMTVAVLMQNTVRAAELLVRNNNL